jgi:hypothetical protein
MQTAGFMFSCDTCGKAWPENYCPECGHTIRQESKSSPPLLPAQLPPVIPQNVPARLRNARARWVIIAGAALAVLVVAGVFAYHLYQGFVFPPGYRNRPSAGWHRPGHTEFSRADDQIDSFQGTNAFGNSPEAVALARHFADAFKAARAQLFTPGFKREILDDTKGEFITYCELHREECAFIVHVPQLRHFDKDITEQVDARKMLAQTAWMTAQGVLKTHGAAKSRMELAVGLRGISQYGPIMLGYYEENAKTPEDGLIKYLDDRTQTHFLWTFFAPEGEGRAK